MARKRLWVGAAVISLGAALFAGTSLWRANRTFSEIQDQVTAEGSLRVSVRPWSAAIPAGLELAGFPAEYTDAQEYEGRLYIAGPAGLAEYDAEGALVRRFRAGIELPPAPVTSLAVGLAGDSPMPELWLGTAGEGLVAFDGRTLRHIRPEAPEHAKISALLPLPTGRILLGTERAGVLSWDGRRLTAFHPSLASVPVTTLLGDDAELWVGTLDRGLLHWKAGAIEPMSGFFPEKRVLCLARYENTIYVGTAAGIAAVEGNAVRRVLAEGYFAQSLFADGDKLWVGTLEEGMMEVPLEARGGRGARLASGACRDCAIRKMFRTGGHRYALATDSLWRGDEMVLGPEASTLKHRNISALAVESTGRLWIGYFDRGLQILSPGGQRELDFEDDRLFCVNRIVHDADRGVSAVATANGLVLMDRAGRRRTITQADGLIANQVTDVALGANNSLIAATPAGVSFIDASGIGSLYAFQGLVNNHVYALATDGSRTLAGTLGGLSVIEGGFVKTSYTTANSALKHNWITAIVPVGREHFVGTYGAGVWKLDAAGRWESFEDLRGLVEINPNAMATSPGAVYAGTLDRGLAVYNRSSGRWNYFTAGLPSRNVTAVTIQGGVLYVGTDNGLVKAPETSVVAQ